MRRREEVAGEPRRPRLRPRRVDRDALTLLDDFLLEIIAKVAHDEYQSMRIERRNRLHAAKSDETLSRRTRKTGLENRRTSLESATDDERSSRRIPAPAGALSSRDSRADLFRAERRQVRGELVARPSASSLATSARPPRRFYQKSEIHEGDKCIEILEILEYVNGSPSSPETTNSDENQGRGSRRKKSRIPVPVYERSHRSIGSDHMRLTGGDGRGNRAGAAAVAGLLLEAFSSPASTGPTGPTTGEPSSRSDSLRFKHVFDIIPEERSSLSVESSASCEESAGVGAGPAVARGTRSAATSPPAPAAPRRLREQTTMTSPYSKSAGTSPMRPPPPPPREGILCAYSPPPHRRTTSLAVE